MRETLSQERIATIIEQEIRRVGRVEGQDLDDLRQEARLRVAQISGEARLPMAKRRKKWLRPKNDETGAAAVRTAVRNRLINMKRDSQTNGRLPHDAFGRRTYLSSLDMPKCSDDGAASSLLSLTPDASAYDPESAAIVADLIERLEAQMPRRELRQRLLDALTGQRVKGPLKLAHERAMSILTDLLHRVDGVGSRSKKEDLMTKVVVVPPPENPPECFATGKQPLGYDPAETECRQSCPDKVSCLPLALEKKIYKKGTAPAPDVDHEINVVRSGIVPLDAVLARMKLRRDAIAKFRKEKGDDAALPADLFSPEIRVEAKFEQEAQAPAKPPRQTKKEKAAEKQPDLPVASETKDEQTAPSSEAATTDDTAAEGAGAADAETETTETTTTETEGTETDMSKNKGKKSASKKATKAATKKAPPPPTKAAAKSKGKPATKKAASTPRKRATVTKKDGREIVCGRKLPAPTEGLNTERMAASLKRIKIGAPFHLDIGMTITKKMRDGDLVITVEKTGYRLKKDGKLYSSLSGAVMNATKRLASCNEFFNVEKNKNVEITGKGVPKGKYTSADA